MQQTLSRILPAAAYTRTLAIASLCLTTLLVQSPALAVDSSSPAILQIFEARWETIEDRMADIHEVGYGRMWVPPVARGGSVFSVGYDVFDRFDLGSPRDQTHYGTAEGFRRLVDAAHDAGVAVNPDLILNHNGVGNRTDANFVNLGGYPGFALTLPGDVNGDFHDPFIDALTDDQILGQLAGLNDIAQEKNHQFIRHPVAAGDPANIPAGTVFNLPDPDNARLYPDQDLGGTVVFDPRVNQNVTLYDYNAADPLAGDPVEENALGLLMRNVRWMIQEYDVDGFRLDAARHFPRWVLDYFDQAAYLARRDPLLDGSPNHVYSFSETGFDSPGYLQDFIRKDIDNNNLGTVGGNRDVLDFRLFNRLKDNLTGNGAANNWHEVRSAPMDLNDDGLMNGSQGVAFVQSHDETGAFLSNVAHAYTLLLPGNSLVYLNAEEYGPTGTFPQPGKADALGGVFGDTITTLVEIRNTHGRGNFRERWIDDAFNPSGFSNVYVYERENAAIVGLNSRNDAFIETRNNVQTGFAPGTVLVELTGNAADATVDPGGAIPEAIRVDGVGQIDLSIPANDTHGRGYVVYGVARPEGALTLGGASGTLPGATPTPATNGTARLADIPVVSGDTFSVRLDTTPVTLPAPAGEVDAVRDVHADGDTALLKIDEGVDLNSNPGVDVTTPGDVAYGFEQFTDVHLPGYLWDGAGNIGSGTGVYEQTIDATQLAEGRHYLTVRAFRHRNAETGGDGGPAVFTDFKETIYVDRLPPDASLESFDPFASDPGDLANRDLIVRNPDGTADNMHFFLDLPAATTEAEIRQMVANGVGDAADYDRDSFIFGYFGVTTGNHVVTVVTFEPTGNSGITRIPGVFTNTLVGSGFGDLDADGVVEATDLAGVGNGSFEEILASGNTLFNAAADVTGDGLIDNRDLLALETTILAGAVGQPALDAYDGVRLARGDVDQNLLVDGADAAAIYAALGTTSGAEDLNVDGTVDLADLETLVEELVRTESSDFDLNRVVGGSDFLTWQRHVGTAADRLDQGDADLDGMVAASDLEIWQEDFGFQTAPFAAVAGAGRVPEPTGAVLALLGWLGLAKFQRSNSDRQI